MMDMMNNGQGGGMIVGMWFFFVLFWAFVIAGVVFIVRWLMENNTKESPSEDSPVDILKRRYAKGEIDRETFERMKQDIGDRSHEK